MVLIEFLVVLATIGVASLSNTTQSPPHNVRAVGKREIVNLDIFGGVSSVLVIGKSAYNLITSIESKKTDKPFQCINNARIQIEASLPATVKMCTKDWSSEWQESILNINKYKKGFQYKYDVLKVNRSPLQFISFEYLGSVCIHFLAFSCGPSTVKGFKTKGVNFIIGSRVLEKWYTWNTDKNLHGIRRCGEGNRGIRLDKSVEVSFTVKSEAFYCKEDDQFCIANNVFFNNGFTNCYKT
nr:uncharacterized protein LOC124808484 [Hydra vulgaris]